MKLINTIIACADNIQVVNIKDDGESRNDVLSLIYEHEYGLRGDTFSPQSLYEDTVPNLERKLITLCENFARHFNNRLFGVLETANRDMFYDVAQLTINRDRIAEIESGKPILLEETMARFYKQITLTETKINETSTEIIENTTEMNDLKNDSEEVFFCNVYPDKPVRPRGLLMKSDSIATKYELKYQTPTITNNTTNQKFPILDIREYCVTGSFLNISLNKQDGSYSSTFLPQWYGYNSHGRAGIFIENKHHPSSINQVIELSEKLVGVCCSIFNCDIVDVVVACVVVSPSIYVLMFCSVVWH